MISCKDVIKCENCGNGARLNKYYDLLPLDDSCVIPENIGAWYQLQVDHIRAMIEAQPDISMSDTAVLLQTSENKWLRPVGQGTIHADRNGFTYEGERNGEQFSLKIPLSAICAVAFSQGRSIELYYQGEFYSFEPVRAVECQRWSMFIEQMHKAYYQ